MSLDEAEKQELLKTFSYFFLYAADEEAATFDDLLTLTDSGGDTVLHVAASYGDARSVELLLKAGMDSNVLGDMSNTPLHDAKTEQVARLLLAHGALKTLRNDFGELPPWQ